MRLPQQPWRGNGKRIAAQRLHALRLRYNKAARHRLVQNPVKRHQMSRIMTRNGGRLLYLYGDIAGGGGYQKIDFKPVCRPKMIRFDVGVRNVQLLEHFRDDRAFKRISGKRPFVSGNRPQDTGIGEMELRRFHKAFLPVGEPRPQ